MSSNGFEKKKKRSSREREIPLLEGRGLVLGTDSESRKGIARSYSYKTCMRVFSWKEVVVCAEHNELARPVKSGGIR